MSGSTGFLVVDILVLLALAVMIFYAVRLSRYFSTLKRDQEQMQALVKNLDTAASRAENAVRALKETASSSGDELQETINQARALSDELGLMIEAGDNLANRLQGLAEKSRKTTTAAAMMAESGGTPASADVPAKDAPRTRAERELAEALKAKGTH